MEEISVENDDIRPTTSDEKMDFIKREYHNKDRIINTYEVGDYQIVEYITPTGTLVFIHILTIVIFIEYMGH